MARVNLFLLGRFEVRLETGPALQLPKKTQALVAYLALHAPQACPRTEVAALLWGETGDVQAHQNLRKALSGLRRAFGRVPALLDDHGTLALDPAVVDVDVVRFERLAAAAGPEALAAAAGLYRGPLLAGLDLDERPFDEWLLVHRERIRELALNAMARLLAHQTETRDVANALETASRLLALDPLHEPTHRALMRLYAADGRRATALRQYQTCVEILRRELGVEPDAETRRVYQQVLHPPPPVSGATGAGAGTIVRPPAAATTEPPVMERRPLIGRDAEMTTLGAALDGVGAGRGAVVFLVGPMGIGKSRLLDALSGEAQRRGVRVLLGRAHESEQILPFGPWVDALRSGGITTDADVLARLGAAWRAQLARLLPEVSADGPPASPEDYLRLFESVAQVVDHLAARQPLALTFEDLHWADEMTLRLLAYLARRIRAAPVVIVATARDDELAATPALRRVMDELGRESHVRTLSLPLLSRSDAVALVRALTRTGTDEARLARLGDRVWAVSEGHPFVVVETLRELEERGESEAEALPFPERVRHLITRRLERLSDRAGELVEVAAVVGRECAFDLLALATERSESETAEALEELVRLGILQGVGERFDFAHDRIREVVIGEIFPARRKLIHARVARTLQALHGADLTPHHDALARHYREGGVWDRAVHHLRLAGSAAAARFAHREAVACFEQALGTLPHLPETRERIEEGIDLRFALRASLWLLGEFEAIGLRLAEAEALAGKLGDQRRLGQTLVYLCANLWFTGRASAAYSVGRRAQAIARSVDERRLGISSTIFAGLACIGVGDHREAAEILRGLSAVDDAGHRDRLGTAGYPVPQALGWLAWSLAEGGRLDEAEAQGLAALRLGETLEDPHTIAVACRGLANVYRVKGDAPEAIRLAERGAALCREWTLTAALPSLTGTLGHLYATTGRIAEGLDLLRDAYEATRSLGFGFFHSLIAVRLGEACLVAGQLEEAQRVVARGLELARAGGQDGCEAEALAVLAAVIAERRPSAPEAALEAYGAAIAIAERRGLLPLAAHCRLGLGSLHRRLGHLAHAREHLAAAARAFHELGITRWLDVAESEVAALR
jgi:DNA-binding SARP family transcriptional activator/ABC-type cobalamin/Fe3+-siderophores transport system ATPase subunit